MTNLLYDFNFGWPVTPHIGAGIGAVDIIDHARAPGLGHIFNDNDWQFGYQGIAGLRYNATPNIAVDLDYRYLATTDPTFKALGGAKYTSEYSTHNLVASLTWLFAAPPPPPPQSVAPPPPPPPAPAVPRVRG